MNRRDFETVRRPLWSQLEAALVSLERRSSREERERAAQVLPRLYREACRDLALVSHRYYSGTLQDELNQLVARGYQALHQASRPRVDTIFSYIFHRIPHAVRAYPGTLILCVLAFLLPYLALWLSAGYDIRWIQSILGPEGMRDLRSMYGAGDVGDHLREEHGSNFMMFAFYVWNNIGIDFRIFAGGIFFGVGSLFFLLFNGIYIGAAAGYIHYACDPEKFYLFVVGHSSWELIGMVLAGMAGMRLGLALLSPGRKQRRAALATAGRDALPLILGGAGMTFVAALIESFWSAENFEPVVKYTFGGAMWLLVIAWLTLSGRGHAHGSR